VGVDRRHQRQDAEELGAGRLEREIEPEELAGRASRAGDAELEVVETEIGGLEGVDFVRQVGGDIGVETQPYPVEVGQAGKAGYVPCRSGICLP